MYIPRLKLASVALGAVLLICMAATHARIVQASGPATLTVSGTQWGVSSAYLGANEGSSGFNIADLQDLGINTYRIYGGMSRWEAQDDDGVYGSPTIDQIKANPGVINWAWWDNIMTNPPNGTDYWWSSDAAPWMGNARTMLQQLHDNNIKVVLVLRNRDNNGNPTWMANPPVTQADWNEWWEHVFATVYWLNVRNNYGVDDFEVHNEPDKSGQGWGGTEAQYEQLVQQTADAIHYVYATYLPGRTPHIYAPVTAACCAWADQLMRDLGPTVFDSLDFHDYQSNVLPEAETLHGYMNSDGFANANVVVSEHGSWHQNVYDSQGNGNSLIIANWIRASSPGNDHVWGMHLFSLYDWGSYASGAIHGCCSKTPGYYAMRIAARALTGARPTYQVSSSNSYLVSVATTDSTGAVYLISCNTGTRAVTVDVNLSALKTSGTGTQWEYSSVNLDAVVASPTLSNGHVTVTIPGNGTTLLKF